MDELSTRLKVYIRDFIQQEIRKNASPQHQNVVRQCPSGPQLHNPQFQMPQQPHQTSRHNSLMPPQSSTMGAGNMTLSGPLKRPATAMSTDNNLINDGDIQLLRDYIPEMTKVADQREFDKIASKFEAMGFGEVIRNSEGSIIHLIDRKNNTRSPFKEHDAESVIDLLPHTTKEHEHRQIDAVFQKMNIDYRTIRERKKPRTDSVGSNNPRS